MHSDLLLLAFFTIVIAVITGYMIVASRSFAPWIPSSARMAERGLTYIQPKPNQRFIDLGCGDGRIVFLAADRYGLNATGYEISLLPYWIAKIRQFFHLNKTASIIRKNLFSAKLADFDIIYLYGLPENLSKKLEPKLSQEAKRGTFILSYNFSLPNQKPIKEFHDRWRNLYVYRVS